MTLETCGQGCCLRLVRIPQSILFSGKNLWWKWKSVLSALEEPRRCSLYRKTEARVVRGGCVVAQGNKRTYVLGSVVYNYILHMRRWGCRRGCVLGPLECSDQALGTSRAFIDPPFASPSSFSSASSSLQRGEFFFSFALQLSNLHLHCINSILSNWVDSRTTYKPIAVI